MALRTGTGKEKKTEELTMDDFPGTTIDRKGKQIIVPEDMPLEIAEAWINRRRIEEESIIAINETIDAYALDGAHAFAAALAETYGFASLVPTPGFWGPTQPTMLSVEVGVDETIQVPWGRVKVPGIEGYLQTSVGRKHGRPVFQISGEVRQKSKPAVKALADLTRKLVRETSIYKGKALRMYFPDYTQENFDPSTDMPKFIDLRSVNPKALIFGQAVQDQIDVSLLTPIRKTAIARAQRIPLKRGILLHGPWGVGKTLTAYVTAAICLEHGWTFIYLNEVEQLARAIPFARQYQPAVIFAEDLDRVAETRDDVLNELLNTIDGVDSKSSEVMVVLTTNNLGHIDASMLRPGRLDAIIEVSPPDAEAAIRLVRLYAGPLIPEQANLYNVGLALDGKIPAVIREVVERSKLSAINRMSDADEQVELNATDLLIAARGMNEHLALLKPVVADTRSQMEKAAVVFAESLGRVFADLSHGNGEQREREQRQLQLPG